MKLTKLHIDSYKHLENLTFDFTYPEGHEKAGQPLEKICIIGQSATGKTNILELVKDIVIKLDQAKLINETYIAGRLSPIFEGQIDLITKNVLFQINRTGIVKDGELFSFLHGDWKGQINRLTTEDFKLLYFSADIISKEAINILNRNPIDFTEDIDFKRQLNREFFEKYIFEFSQEANKAIWISLLSKILDYRKRFTQLASELFSNGSIADAGKLHDKYSEWSAKNPHHLIGFSELINPILNKLNLEVDLVNTEYLIPIKSKLKDEVIPISGLSTGTKGLLLSMFPMFELDTTDAIILMDEPERSLFPDMQIDLIPHYQKMAPSAQFIVSTHSPFIAAAFEPEERFILYFDEQGKVALRKGESPIGDDPNDLLTNDFRIDYYNEFGKQAYKDYLELKTKLRAEKNEDKQKELLIELSELGDKYNF